jgi:hypothetical protein
MSSIGGHDCITVALCTALLGGGVVKRTLVRLLELYLLFAVIGRFVEGMGAAECRCSSDCWYKQPILSIFRWVFPHGHRLSSPTD